MQSLQPRARSRAARTLMSAAALVLLFVVATGQASTDGCEVSDPQPPTPSPDSQPVTPGRNPETGGGTQAPEPDPAAAAPAGGPPVGRYNCHYTHMMQVIPAGSLISILPGGRYQYLDQGTGGYAYDAGTGSLQWLSGPLAGSGVAGEFTYRDDGRPLIRLKLPGAGVNQRGEPTTQTNRCVGPAQ